MNSHHNTTARYFLILNLIKHLSTTQIQIYFFLFVKSKHNHSLDSAFFIFIKLLNTFLSLFLLSYIKGKGVEKQVQFLIIFNFAAAC